MISWLVGWLCGEYMDEIYHSRQYPMGSHDKLRLVGSSFQGADNFEAIKK